MTPFKIKVTIDQYESMGYKLAVGDVLYHKDKACNLVKYAELVSFDEKANVWTGKDEKTPSFKVAKENTLIQIVVIPFDQYVKKLRLKGIPPKE